MSDKRILDLGCGERKTAGAVGVDRVRLEGVDVVHDFETFPYPFKSDSFDRIVVRHAAEHVSDLIGFMGEIYRIGTNKAIVEIYTPHFTSINSYNDPTHKHHFSLFSFDFFCGRTEHGYLTNCRYRLIRREADFWPLHDKFRFVPYHWFGIRWLAIHHTAFYERFLAFIFPIKEFRVFLSIVKD